MKKTLLITIMLSTLIGYAGQTGIHKFANPLCQSSEVLDIPTQRRIAQFLAQLNQSEQVANIPGGVWFEGCVTPMYRPDLDGPAYYEVRLSPRGYLVVSTGDHDMPITNWDIDNELSPSQFLLDYAAESEQDVARIYKLDALSYVAENAAGEAVAQDGQIPPRPEGIDVGAIDFDQPRDVSFDAVPEMTEPEDREEMPELDYQITREGEELPLEFGEWESWQQVKEEYSIALEAYLTSLRHQAAEDWDTDRLAQEFGEGITLGESFELPALSELEFHEISGPGSEYVMIDRIENETRPASLLLTPVPGFQEELDFSITLYYTDGRSEQLPMFAVPYVQHGKAGAWGRWNTTHAGWYPDQRLYRQIKNFGCVTGCGPVAWSMLFGWIDYQASKNHPLWRGRWGIYRANGGRGNNVIAPRDQNYGPLQMQAEIRNQVGTFCIFGSAATLPSSMSGAYRYLRGRTYGRLTTRYNPWGVAYYGAFDNARYEILVRKTPVVIGTGALSHYPLAWGYSYRSRIVRHCFFSCWTTREYQRQFRINNGWGAYRSMEWIPANTWFAGSLY